MEGPVTNIGARGVRLRGGSGAIMLVAGSVLAVVLVALGLPHWWRLVLLIPFGLAANGLLQAREKTCVVLAALGTREADDGGRSYVPVADRERAVLRRRAASIVLRSALIAAILTAIVWWL